MNLTVASRLLSLQMTTLMNKGLEPMDALRQIVGHARVNALVASFLAEQHQKAS